MIRDNRGSYIFETTKNDWAQEETDESIRANRRALAETDLDKE